MNVLNLEPVFTVRRGRLAIRRLMAGYVRSTEEQFIRSCLVHRNGINPKKLYVTFSGCPVEEREHVLQEIGQYIHFDEVIVIKASATTFSNCGPNSVGLLYEAGKDN